MKKTCFVIMGYGIKNGLDLDKTYYQIIKPCIEKNGLVPYKLFDNDEFNAFRCDEISGSASIDFEFVMCLNGADIVIADISTMNNNAIYELGARHALKPRSTILLCAKDKMNDFRFFDLTYVPIIFYEHDGLHIKPDAIKETCEKLNKSISFSVKSNADIPDNPISRALKEIKAYRPTVPDESIYQVYQEGMSFLSNNEFDLALSSFKKLIEADESEENVLLYTLAWYKNAEKNYSTKGLIECLNYMREKLDIEKSLSEEICGRAAAISLRIFNASKDVIYYHEALRYYMRGASLCRKNLYCPRNYCALLLRIIEVTDDNNVIREYYYTAKHHAKAFLHMNLNTSVLSFEEQIYYRYNKQDLNAIINDGYSEYNKTIEQISTDNEITPLQKETLLKGIERLNNSIITICDLLKQ